MLRNSSIWNAATKAIGMVTSDGGAVAGMKPTTASTTTWRAMVQRSE